MAPSVLQSGGFILGLIGAAALVAATAASKWSVRDRPEDEDASLYQHQGLWQDCATTLAGSTRCGWLRDVRGSSGALWAVRALVMVGVPLSILGAAASLSSLMPSSLEASTKARMSLTAGVAFIISGVSGITGASIYSSHILASLMSSTYGGQEAKVQGGTPAYTFGPASFVGLIGGNVLVIAGILKAVAFRETVKNQNASHLRVAYKKPQLHFRTHAGAEQTSGGQPQHDSA